MKVRFCGVRGSTPSPGFEFAGVGGHTSCVAITRSDAELPTLLLDAGTGIRRLPAMFGDQPFRGTILLTHLHWDHLQGLPFCPSIDRDDAVVRLLMPAQEGSVAEVMRRAMSPPHFPIGPEGLRGSWAFEYVDPGAHDIEGMTVLARAIPHKGGVTYGYRIDDGDFVMAYLPDHRPASTGRFREAALELSAGVDLLIHDAQFLADEAGVADAYGHSTVDQAVELALASGAEELVLFHHAPGRTDAEVESIGTAFADSAPGLVVSVAREGEDRCA